MQSTEVLPFSTTNDSCSSSEFTEISAKLSEDLSRKLQIDGVLGNQENEEVGDDDNDESDGESDEEDEFSFVCLNPDGSPIRADDAFRNGQIRPVFPIFNRALLFEDDADVDSMGKKAVSLRPPLKKLFVEERDSLPSSSAPDADELAGVPTGTYCEWSRKAVETSPELCKKSNSTGFSRLWRFRDLVHHRSKSDGKDAFVFLSNSSAATAAVRTKPSKEKTEKIVTVEERRRIGGKVKAVRGETASSIHRRHYARNRAQKEAERRKSYLPYKQDLVGFGFLTSVSGLSKNVHPY